MSDLWTPDSKPAEDEPSGGIELPKGFARRRTEEEKKRESETKSQPQEPSEGLETVETPTPGTPAGTTPQPAGREAGDFLFPPSGAQIQCPSCSTPFTAAVFSIVDLGANPELRQALLAGQLNVASCPQCGAGGALSAPLMVHDPENKFLGVLVPSQAGLNDSQVQKVIGEMTQALMRELPKEERRGYMLNAQQFFDWESFLEKFWGFEGVTPEDLKHQREQAELVSSLARLADDEDAMRLVVERRKHLIDENFFSLLGQVMQAVAAQEESENLEALQKLRQHLLDTTEAGSKVKAMEGRLREAMGRINPNMGREELLDLLMEYWSSGDDGERIVATLLTLTPGMADYQFLMTLAGRLDAATDEEERADLMELRELIVSLTEQQNRSRQAQAQQAQALLQEVLQATDTQAKLREHADELDESFLAILAANIQQAEERQATFAVRRLRSVYEEAVRILEEQMPPEMRLLNQLLTAQDESTVRNLLKEHRSDLNQDFVTTLKSLEGRFQQEGNPEMAARIKRIRGQVALML